VSPYHHPSVHRRTFSRLGALSVAVALGAGSLGACSKDSGGNDTTSASSTTAATTTEPGKETTAPPDTLDPRLEADMRAAMARAEKVSLTKDDLATNWQSLPPAEGDEGPLEACTEVDLDTHLMGLYRSNGFSNTVDPGALQVSSSVTVMDDESAATDLMADMRTDRFVGCVNDLFNGSTDTVERKGEIKRNETAPDLGDEAVALSGEFVVSPLDGTPDHPVSMVVVAFRTGDMITTLNSTAVDRNLDEQLIRDLLDKLLQRATAN